MAFGFALVLLTVVLLTLVRTSSLKLVGRDKQLRPAELGAPAQLVLARLASRLHLLTIDRPTLTRLELANRTQSTLVFFQLTPELTIEMARLLCVLAIVQPELNVDTTVATASGSDLCFHCGLGSDLCFHCGLCPP